MDDGRQPGEAKALLVYFGGAHLLRQTASPQTAASGTSQQTRGLIRWVLATVLRPALRSTAQLHFQVTECRQPPRIPRYRT